MKAESNLTLPSFFTPLEIMPSCSLRAKLRPGRARAPEGGPLSEPEAGPAAATGLDFRIIPPGFNAPLEFLTGFT